MQAKNKEQKPESQAEVKAEVLTVVHGKKGLIAIYKDGLLVCTQDKFTTPRELERSINAHADGREIKEVNANFSTFAAIPEEYKS